MSSTKRKIVAAQNKMTPEVEQSFRSFVARAGGHEQAARLLFTENYLLRRRLKEREDKKQSRSAPSPGSPYRDVR